MNEGSYYSSLINNYPEKARYLEWMKYELDGRVYHYGEHFKYPYEDSRTSRKIHDCLSALKQKLLAKKSSSVNDYRGCILSEAYFSVDKTLSNLTGLKSYRFPWHEGSNVFADREISKTIFRISTLPFNTLISDSFCARLDRLYYVIKEFVSENSIRLVVFPNDLSAIHRIGIDACKSAGVPTVIFLHGLPGRYNSIDDNRADFLCVWGDAIKEQYIKQGIDPNKVIVSGHPSYSKVDFPDVTLTSFENPLVLTNSVNGAPSSSDEYRISDRGVSICYAWAVEKALKQIGVSHAVLRLHPSERPIWYERYVDMEFYTIDNLSLNDSLKSSTFVVGPTSTVSMDAASIGIPYFCFEQKMKYSCPLVPPFDGSEKDFPVALSVDDLVLNLKESRFMQPVVFKKYISLKYDLSELLRKAKLL